MKCMAHGIYTVSHALVRFCFPPRTRYIYLVRGGVRLQASHLRKPLPRHHINPQIIEAHFESLTQRTFSYSGLLTIFNSMRSSWNLPRSMGPKAFIEMLVRKTKLSQVKLRSANYPSLLRYTWGTPRPLSVALSIKHAAYCSHSSAMWIHGLGAAPGEIYVNSEQSEKSAAPVVLTQAAIDRAFRNQQRRSKLIYKLNEVKIVVLNGKNTGRLEVEIAKAPSGEYVDVTSLERTLVDSVVRPAYAGGVPNILEAFRLARERASVNKLLHALKLLDHAYPFHQSIGFYMKKSGYSTADQETVKRLPMPFNFYTGYGMKDPAFDTDFKVFYDQSFE
jgi:hypothetical protein